MKHRLNYFIKSYGLQLGVLALIWIIFSSTTPSFGGMSSLYGIVENFALLGIIAVGMSVTIFVGELDFSVSSIAGIAGVIAVRSSGLGLVGSIVVATLVGALIGAVQGSVIHKLQLNSFVFTIGSQIFLAGVSFMLANNLEIPLLNLKISDPLLNRWSIFQLDSILGLVIFFLIWLFLTFTRPGREVVAIGGGRREATSAGVPVGRIIIWVFVLSAACAAFAGAVASLKGGGASPNGFIELLLTAPAAILVGGVSLQDGRGTVLNVLLGVAILSAVTTGLSARNEQSVIINLVIGSLLLAVVIAQFAIAQREVRAPSRRPSAWSIPPTKEME